MPLRQRRQLLVRGRFPGATGGRVSGRGKLWDAVLRQTRDWGTCLSFGQTCAFVHTMPFPERARDLAPTLPVLCPHLPSLGLDSEEH